MEHRKGLLWFWALFSFSTWMVCSGCWSYDNSLIHCIVYFHICILFTFFKWKKKFYKLGKIIPWCCFVVVVRSLSHTWLFVIRWAAAHQASVSFTVSQSLFYFMVIELVMPSNHLNFSSCTQSFPASESFPVSQLFTSGGKVLESQLLHQSFKWIFRVDFL